MKLLRIFNDVIKEETNKANVYYHGSSTKFPFQSFDAMMDGSGIVSNGKKYGGFFFTNEIDNAEFYTEYFICKVRIADVIPNPYSDISPSQVLSQGNKDNKIYMVSDVFDGSMHSDVVVVPIKKVQNIVILDWLFVGDEDFYFNKLDEMIGGEDDYVSKDSINEFCSMVELNLEYLLKIPIWLKYYNSK